MFRRLVGLRAMLDGGFLLCRIQKVAESLTVARDSETKRKPWLEALFWVMIGVSVTGLIYSFYQK